MTCRPPAISPKASTMGVDWRPTRHGRLSKPSCGMDKDANARLAAGHCVVGPGDARLFLQLPLEDLDFLGESHIVADQTFDLAHGMQHRGVVAATEAPADLGQ